jgi:hypothetical protein
LFVYFVEFFAFVSFLKEKDWKKISKLDFKKNLKKKFVCVVCLFVEFVVFENVHSDCEFCDSTLIFFRLSASCFIALFAVFSISESSAKENQSSFISFFSMKKKEFEIEKKVIFTSCSSVCFFVDYSIENLFAFIFSIFELNFLIFFVWSSSAFLNLRKYGIVQKKKKKFLNVKIVTKKNVSKLCETKNSNLLLLNKFFVEIIEIEIIKKEEKKFFLFRIFCDRLCLKLLSRQRNWKFAMRHLNHWRKSESLKESSKKKEECFSKRSINIKRID